MLSEPMTSLLQPLEQTVVALARGAGTPQRMLDAAYWADLRAWGELVRGSQFSPADPLLQAVAPVRFQLTRTQIEAQVAVEGRREHGYEIAARLQGRVVCGFFEARYGSAERQWNRLSLEIEAVLDRDHTTSS